MAHPIASYGEAAAVPRPASVPAAANACAGAVGTFVALLALLHVIEPELDPTWRFVSEYAGGPMAG